MGYYSSTGCDDLYEHNCDPCEPQEHGRVQRAAYVHISYHSTLMADPTNPALWIAGINAGKIMIIPKTNGSVGKGSKKEISGYGKAKTTITGYDFAAMYRDKNYASNANFYNNMVGNQNWHFVYVTDTLGHCTSVPVTIVPNNEVKDDLNSVIEWEVDVEWVAKGFPVPFTIPPGVFEECFTTA